MTSVCGMPLSMVEVEHPHERFTSRSSGQPGSLQYGRHALWRVNKRSKLLACRSQPEVPQRKHAPHVPTVTRIGERQHLPGSGRCCHEQCVCIKVAADDAVQRHHVSVGQGNCDRSEVAEDELGGT